MDSFVARANIDHYIALLNDPDVAVEKRATVTTLLMQEVDKLRGDLEQLEFAERRAADGRDRLHHLRSRRSDPGAIAPRPSELLPMSRPRDICLRTFVISCGNKVNNHH